MNKKFKKEKKTYTNKNSKKILKKQDKLSKKEEKNIDTEEDNLKLEGRNAVLEALKNDKEIDKIFIKRSDEGNVEGSLKVIKSIALEKKVVILEVSKSKLDSISDTKSHQGVIAVCPPITYVSIDDIIENANARNEVPFVIIIDSITDPHNLGAIIRTAEACGVHGVIIPKRRNVGISGIVSKSSAGAVELVPICKVTNITNAINELKEKGFWIGCGDMEGQSMYDTDLLGPIAIVIGSEGFGVSRLVKENCDFVLSIPMYGKIGSLNASVAASVLMYEAIRQRLKN